MRGQLVGGTVGFTAGKSMGKSNDGKTRSESRFQFHLTWENGVCVNCIVAGDIDGVNERQFKFFYEIKGQQTLVRVHLRRSSRTCMVR